MNFLDFLVFLVTLLRDLSVAWSPMLLIAVLVVGGVQVTRMVRLARANSATRARRRQAMAQATAQSTLAA